MQSIEDLKKAVCQEIDRRQGDILEIGDTILNNPELGFKEFKTAAAVARKFSELGLAYQEGLAITGVKAKASSGRPGPTVAVMGELDALVVKQHPLADRATGAAHACGHNGQIASMLGAAIGLMGAKALDQFAGNVVFFAVPAEELVEIEWRMSMREQGKLDFITGKQQLLCDGHFDDVDMCMLVHGTPRPEEKLAGAQSGNNGCIAKMMQYIGKAAHAGSMPHKAINALNAATIAMNAIHTQRETFRDQDSVRVHPIITRGGDAVNVVPSDVRMETFVRGKTVEAIEDADAKVDRCLRAGAQAVGANLKITTIPGYAPLVNHRGLMQLYKQNVLPLIGGEQNWTEGGHRSGSTDMGDMSLIMPTLQPYNGGVSGNAHGADYLITDRAVFYLNPAKAMAMTVVDLLYGDASGAQAILGSSKPQMTRQEYLAYQRRMARVEEYQG